MANDKKQSDERPMAGFFTMQQVLDQETDELRHMFEGRRPRGEIVKKIEAILDFVLQQFSLEERIMHGIGYPFEEQHRLEHRQLTDVIAAIRRSLQGRNVQLKRGYPEFLSSLLRGHFFVFDTPLEFAAAAVTEANPNLVVGILPPTVVGMPGKA